MVKEVLCSLKQGVIPSLREIAHEGGKPPSNPLYRCNTCNNLFGDIQLEAGICVGHQVVYATTGSWWEWCKIYIFKTIK